MATLYTTLHIKLSLILVVADILSIIKGGDLGDNVRFVGVGQEIGLFG